MGTPDGTEKSLRAFIDANHQEQVQFMLLDHLLRANHLLVSRLYFGVVMLVHFENVSRLIAILLPFTF